MTDVSELTREQIDGLIALLRDLDARMPGPIRVAYGSWVTDRLHHLGWVTITKTENPAGLQLDLTPAGRAAVDLACGRSE